MGSFVSSFVEALQLALGMAWQVAWSLVLGFAASAAIQTLVSNQRVRSMLGRGGPREIALATVFGAASSSCSYASAAVTRTLFAKGAALAPSLAFLVASTNLVVELGLVLWILMGWQFTAAEWIGGVVMIAILSALVALTYPKRLIENGREHARHAAAGMDHDMVVEGDGFWQKVRNPRFEIVLAQHFTMDWEMLRFDVALGFVIAGFLGAFVPDGFWRALSIDGQPHWIELLGGAIIGPLVAVVTFVCSIGNVPMAAILWAGGFGFSGVLAFLYADLIVLPLLDVYRKQYGWRFAFYLAGMLFVTMIAGAIVMDVAFSALHLVPPRIGGVRAHLATFSFNYTFWLNLIALAGAARLAWVAHRNPMDHGCHGHHDHDEHDEAAHGPQAAAVHP